MATPMGSVQLPDGSMHDIMRVEYPDLQSADEISRFYSHKEEHWVWQIEQSLVRKMDELGTRYYIARHAGSIIGGICTYEQSSVGLFSHVYIEERWRGRGAATNLTRLVQADFAERGGRFFVLGTDPGGSAARLYGRAGFRSAAPGYGTMIWEAQAGSYEAYFQHQRCRVVEVAWHHWPLLCALMATEAGGVFSKGWYTHPWLWFENDFLLIMQAVASREARVWLLEGDQGSVLGYAMLSLRWPGIDDWQLTIYAYPGFWDQAGQLLHALGDLPDRTRCYCDAGTERLELLRSAGFDEVARLDSRWGRDTSGAMLLLSR